MSQIKLYQAGAVVSVEGFKANHLYTTEEVVEIIRAIGHAVSNGARIIAPTVDIEPDPPAYVKRKGVDTH